MVTSPTLAGVSNLTKKKQPPPVSPTLAGVSNLTSGDNQGGSLVSGTSNPTAPTRENAAALNPTAPTRTNADRISASRQAALEADAEADRQRALLSAQLVQRFDDPKQFGADTISAATAEQIAGMSRASQFASGFASGFMGEGTSNTAGGESFAVAAGAAAGLGGRGRAVKGLDGLVSQYLKTSAGQMTKAGAVSNAAKAKSTGGLIPANSKIMSLLRKHGSTLMKAAGVSAVTASLAMGVMTSFGLSKFVGKEEAGQAYGMAGYLALSNDNPELAMQVAEESKKLFDDQTFTEQLIGWIPGINVAHEIESGFVPAFKTQMDVVQTIAEDKMNQASTGASDQEIWEQRRQQKLEDEERTREEILKNTELIIKMKAEAADANRAKEAAYWDEQLKKREAFEKRKLKLQQDYWDAYFRRAAEVRAATAPSKLSFGLL